jgi:hypothetical protein
LFRESCVQSTDPLLTLHLGEEKVSGTFVVDWVISGRYTPDSCQEEL